MNPEKPEIDLDTPEGQEAFQKIKQRLKPLSDQLKKLSVDDTVEEPGGPMTLPKRIDILRDHKLDKKGKDNE